MLGWDKPCYASIIRYIRPTVCSWHDPPPPPPWYLFALSHWASHPAVSAFALSWKQPCDRSWVGVRDELWGNGQVFTAERREERGGGERGETYRARQRHLMESWEGSDMEEEEQGVFTPSLRSKACCHCLVELTSNQPTHLSVPRVDPVSLSAACAGCFCFNWFCALYRNYPSTVFFFCFFFSWERWILNNAEGSCQMEARLQGLLRIDKSDSRDITVVWW